MSLANTTANEDRLLLSDDIADVVSVAKRLDGEITRLHGLLVEKDNDISELTVERDEAKEELLKLGEKLAEIEGERDRLSSTVVKLEDRVGQLQDELSWRL